ncbi:MAG: O-antigen ligase family protein, partial [Candidatus Thermoplasmatota archaeon]|nr:O-antigen ligase family protein [Candidatus Thermoplasmatota archaeon]
MDINNSKISTFNKNYIVNILIFLFLYILFISLSFFNAINKILVVKSILKWIEIYFIIIILYFYINSERKLIIFYWFLFLCCFLAVIHSTIDFLTENMSILSFNIYSSYIYYFSFSLLLPFTKIKYKKFIYILIAFCLFSVLMSRSRAMYIAVIICLLYHITFNNRKHKQFIKYAIIVSLIILTVPLFRENLLFFFNTFVFSIKQGSNSERMTLIKLAINTISSNPLIGVGSLNFPIYNFREGIPSGIISTNFDTLGPHNVFLQVASEEGLLGLITFLIFFYYLIKLVLSYSKLNNRYLLGLKYFSIGIIMTFLFGYISSPFRFLLSI